MKIPRRLKIGQEAPDFTGQLWSGGTVQLKSLRGQMVWLAFFRYASCPLCNMRIHEMLQKHEVLRKAKLNIVAVFQSPKESISKYVGSQKPPFPLVADPDEELYRLYGLESSLFGLLAPGNILPLLKAFSLGFNLGKQEGTVTRIPADFLIDEAGMIQEAFYGNKAGDHIPIETVMDRIHSKSDSKQK